MGSQDYVESDLEEFQTLIANMSYEEIFTWLNVTPEDLVDNDKWVRTGLISSLYTLIVLVSFFGNLLVVFVCIKNMTKTNALILSLSTSDLMMTIFNIPFNVVRLLREDWPFGHFMCLSVPFMQVMVVYVSSFTMAVIAFYRWRCVTTLRNSSTSKMWPIIVTILITWVLSAAMAYPPSSYNDIVTIKIYKDIIRCRPTYPKDTDLNIPFILSLEIFLTQYLIPLSLSIIMYIKIGKVISRQGKIIDLRGNIEAKRRQRHKRRRIIMLVLVVAVFATCWLPLNIYHLLVDSMIVAYNYRIFITCHWFAMSSVCYNPFIYCWLNKTFRNGAKKVFSYLFCRCSTSVNPNAITVNMVSNAENEETNGNNRQTIELNIMTSNSTEIDINHIISL